MSCPTLAETWYQTYQLDNVSEVITHAGKLFVKELNNDYKIYDSNMNLEFTWYDYSEHICIKVQNHYEVRGSGINNLWYNYVPECEPSECEKKEYRNCFEGREYQGVKYWYKWNSFYVNGVSTAIPYVDESLEAHLTYAGDWDRNGKQDVFIYSPADAQLLIFEDPPSFNNKLFTNLFGFLYSLLEVD